MSMALVLHNKYLLALIVVLSLIVLIAISLTLLPGGHGGHSLAIVIWDY